MTLLTKRTLGSAFVTVPEILKHYDGDLPDFLFPDLHAKTDSWVAMQNTKDIRKSLPEDLKISDRYSSKSMRRGACTVMTSNHKLKESHALARSGHGNSANHFGTYVENVGIGLSIPAAMVLNEYEDPYRMPVSCSFDGLSNEDSLHVDSLVAKLFPTNIPEFKSEGRLFPALKIMGATLIMSYNAMRSEYKRTDLVVSKLEETFENIGLSIEKLSAWSTTIKDTFIATNSVQQVISSIDADQLIASINHNTSTAVYLKTSVDTMASGTSGNKEKASNSCDLKKTILCANRRKLLNAPTSKKNIGHMHDLRIRKQKYSCLKKAKTLKNHARCFKKES